MGQRERGGAAASPAFEEEKKGAAPPAGEQNILKKSDPTKTKAGKPHENENRRREKGEGKTEHRRDAAADKINKKRPELKVAKKNAGKSLHSR